ncbi:DUF4476 domain-containing protein [Chitinophaga agrisoli]|uniref:DUF4476 domain-containing protein n=1 Tax=Chitinophaga agrisoli TaxID=2607653 RepID=A0A5B2W5E3_9BACT|nr:DUF4476 domain-containing protein [Chitinophaga agrisoli]KAA2245786.1 DUF4476 domain-containing protein [Chitinophaga agrisoli]
MIQYFKRWGYVLAFLLIAGKLAAQETEPQYYIYIQNEKPQPFYVKYKDKVLSSSDRGYIILSELPAGSTSLVVGFPRNEAPEQPFTVRLGKADQGFLLKQTAEQHYALYNLQTYSVTKTSTPEKEDVQPPADPAVGNAAPSGDTEVVATTPAPAADAPVAETQAPDTAGQAMMAAMRRDLDTALAGKAEITSASKQPIKKQPSKFAEALDKVVSDDRPDDIQLEEPAAPPAAGVATAAAGAVTDIAPEGKKPRRKRGKDRAPLTPEEQALLKDVMAQEQQAGQADSAVVVAAAPVTETPAPVTETPAPATETPAPATEAPAVKDTTAPAPPAETQPAVDSAVATIQPADTTPATEPAAEEAPKAKKPKRKKSSDPEFIEFSTDGTQPKAAAPPAEVAAAPVEAATDVAAATDIAPEKASKKKKRKLADVVDGEEHPNNIVTDSVDYSAPVRKEKASALKMINSDCQNVMDDAAFRKLLRKVVAAKDDEGIIESFSRNTRGYCLETAQIRRLAQLLTTDETRYKLLDMAYPKAADSENYAGLSELLSDSYYQGRFKAMLHK